MESKEGKACGDPLQSVPLMYSLLRALMALFSMTALRALLTS